MSRASHRKSRRHPEKRHRPADLSGYDVAKRIRAALNGSIALVAVTGYGQPEDQRRAHDAGFDAHLVKPVTLDQLNDTFAKLRPRASFAESESD